MHCESYSQATAGIAMQTQFSLSAEELSGMLKVHCLVLLGCFCRLLLDFSSLIFFPEKVFW